MSDPEPPLEQQRFARSQTPESPRPVHMPPPSTIPVLLNQMDPVFNDTATYNIPSNQSFSPYGETLENASLQNPSNDEHDAVQSFFREAENQAAAPVLPNPQSEPASEAVPSHEFSSVPDMNQSSKGHVPENTLNDSNVTAASLSGNGETHGNMMMTEPQTVLGNSQNRVEGSQNQEPKPDAHATRHGEEGDEDEAAAGQPGVDYQSLLENISQTTSTAPSAETIPAPTTASPHGDQMTTTLPTFPGLPPKPPPPQENPPEFPNFPDQAQPSAYSFPSTAPNEATHVVQQNGQAGATQIDPSSTLNSAPLPIDSAATAFPLAQFQPPVTATTYPERPSLSTQESSDTYLDPNSRPWTPSTKAAYEGFLNDERRYVTEGIWDRFPLGSRLFVGNLPSEKVTKRDLFHYFYKYGRLAQISIKQAYGFVQYHDAASCLAALNGQQGVEIRGRKVHLEISKPQKNTRGAGASSKNQARRRSRSPERGHRRTSEMRDDTSRRKDDFRNRRSPSPRAYGSRNDFRPPSAARDDRRSPIFAGHQSSPQSRSYGDEESNLPIPRRDPRNVPDVQLIIIDPGVHQSFINWVEDGFRRKGLQASTIWLSQRLSLAAVVKRQIVEGVQAVVKLTSAVQSRSKIPLQVFDRTAGASNVNFNEYADLDVPVAADVVLQARQRERTNVQQPRTPYSAFPQSPYGQPPPNMPFPPPPPLPHFPQHPPHGSAVPPNYPYPVQAPEAYRQGFPPAHAPPTPASQPPNLQELLANLKGPNNPPTPQSAQSTNSRPDLAGLLSNVARQQTQQLSPSAYGPAQPYPGWPPQQSPPQQQPQPGTQQQQNVQNIVAELARYQR